VFDCDGLLMDSETCWTVAETELFARRGLVFEGEDKARLIGTSIQAASCVLAETFDEPGNEVGIQSELLSLVMEVISTAAEAMPGARELVDLVAGALPVAVASNSPRALLDVALARGGFDAHFEIRIAADEVSAPKPAPEMYVRAAKRLRCPRASVLAFEDSQTGVASALAAGVRVVGVPTLPVRDLGAHALVGSLSDPELLQWVEGWPVVAGGDPP
jgi:HAD superfamily hydrolase (TIGR01509 family)